MLTAINTGILHTKTCNKLPLLLILSRVMTFKSVAYPTALVHNLTLIDNE